MKKECKTHVLPTEDKLVEGMLLKRHLWGGNPKMECLSFWQYKETIVIDGVKQYKTLNGSFRDDCNNLKPHHLYITDDSKIEKGDYFIDAETGKLFFATWYNSHYGRKVIATTDHKLLYTTERTERGKFEKLSFSEGVYKANFKPTKMNQISQDFIRQYCENPVESVMVECEPTYSRYRGITGRQTPEGIALKVTEDNCIIISPSEEKMYSYEQVVEAYEEGVSQGMGWSNGDAHKWIKENL